MYTILVYRLDFTLVSSLNVCVCASSAAPQVGVLDDVSELHQAPDDLVMLDKIDEPSILQVRQTSCTDRSARSRFGIDSKECSQHLSFFSCIGIILISAFFRICPRFFFKQALRVRYSTDNIYTNIGDILISVCIR